ncbi:WhiB family transcriptional regulator [Streptomyces sp. NPDC047971]|uniref:WhiB family transcriptional regulator n=1 Tax=Streptomyces sp. NPDC047971 TaxID=3154499 RepID=UPI0033E0C231
MTSTRGISLPYIPNWRASAACLAADPDAMFPDPSDEKGTKHAKGICGTCPVIQECLAEAMAEEGGKSKESRFGIRGGLTGGQRYYLRGRNKAVPGLVAKPKRASTRPLAPCGTPAAYERHVRNHEPVDESCRLAHNAERREARQKAKARNKAAA